MRRQVNPGGPGTKWRGINGRVLATRTERWEDSSGAMREEYRVDAVPEVGAVVTLGRVASVTKRNAKTWQPILPDGRDGTRRSRLRDAVAQLVDWRSENGR